MQKKSGSTALVPATSMLKVWRDIDRTLVARLSRWGMPTGVVAAVIHLYTSPLASEPAQIARAIHIPRQSMTSTLDTLETLGLAMRQPHPQDRRRKKITLSPKGQLLGKEVLSDLLAFEERVMSILTAAERNSLQRLAIRVADQALAVSEKEEKD